MTLCKIIPTLNLFLISDTATALSMSSGEKLQYVFITDENVTNIIMYIFDWNLNKLS